MKYLLDTNIIINHIRGKERISSEIIEQGAAISIITLGELYYGGYKSKNPTSSLRIIAQLLETLGIQVETLNRNIVEEFGEIKADLERLGTRIEDFDLLIAATAKTQNFILISKNIKHFHRIEGIKLYR